VSAFLKDSDVFSKFNDCMDKNFTKEILVSHSHSYENEAQADYWAKRVVGENLRSLKGSSLNSKIQFLKETAMLFCRNGEFDDGVHHPSKLRISRTLRLSRDFIKTFNCSKYSHEMRLQKPIECNLGGQSIALIPEL